MTTKEELEIAFANSIIQRDRLQQENQKLKAELPKLREQAYNLLAEKEQTRTDFISYKKLAEITVKQKEEENQKLKERLKEKEELLDWTINYGEYVIYGLRTEIEELKQLKIEFQSFVKNDYINVYLSPELKKKLESYRLRYG